MGSRLGAALRSRRSETRSGRPADLHGSRLGDTASRRALLSQRLCGSAVCRDLLRRTMWPSAAGNPSWKSRTSALAQACGPNERSFLKRLVGGKSTGSSCGASIAGGAPFSTSLSPCRSLRHWMSDSFRSARHWTCLHPVAGLWQECLQYSRNSNATSYAIGSKPASLRRARKAGHMDGPRR